MACARSLPTGMGVPMLDGRPRWERRRRACSGGQRSSRLVSARGITRRRRRLIRPVDWTAVALAIGVVLLPYRRLPCGSRFCCGSAAAASCFSVFIVAADLSPLHGGSRSGSARPLPTAHHSRLGVGEP